MSIRDLECCASMHRCIFTTVVIDLTWKCHAASMIDQRIRLYSRLSYLYTHHSNTHQWDLMPTRSLLVILCWNFKLTTVSKPVPNPRFNMNTFIPNHNGKHFYNKPWNSKILLTEQCVYVTVRSYESEWRRFIVINYLVISRKLPFGFSRDNSSENELCYPEIIK